MRSLLFAIAGVSAAAVTPVEKVTELLVKLSAKIEEEGQAEAVAYDKFACFCKEQADNKLYAITKSNEKIKKLEAKIELLASEIEKLDKEVADGNARIADLEKESEEGLKLRAEERAEYETADASISRAIKAVRNAITALQESRPSMLLLQEAARLASVSDMEQASVERLQALVAQPVDRTKSAAGGPTNAYEYHSNEIIELLQNLLKQFKAKKEKLFVEESTEKHAFEKVEQARQFEITTTTEAVEVASASSAKKSDEKAKATDNKDSETADRDADQAFLDDVTKQCEDKAKNFDQRSTTRSQELKALSEATALLKGKGGEKYGANKRLNLLARQEPEVEETDASEDSDSDDYELTDSEKDAVETEAAAAVESEDEQENAASFLQISTESMSPKNARVFEVLREAAHRLKSTNLAALALTLKKDHFVKVRTLIKDLIERLEAQAEAEATHKDQCDKDMKAAITQRDESQASMEAENAAITNNKVTIKELKAEIVSLKEQIAETKKALRERTELRAEERAENEKTIADAKEGEQAIIDAVKVLKEFYGEMFTQVSIRAHRQEPFAASNADREGNVMKDLAPEGSSTFEEEYHGSDEAASGIFGLLNIIKSDYTRTIEDTEATEEVAQKEFEAYEKETNEALDQFEKDVEKATKAKAEEKDALMENEDDLADATDSNKSALEKLALLKGECVDGAISHEERVKRREQEIESLKEALNILEEMNFLQKRK